MATLILTTVGTIVGGPIGGAVGAAIGSAIDSKLLAPKGRQGPRLGDLTVQTSRYGAAIPKLFGTLRVAGTVIWATDLREDRHKQGGGKGHAAATTYSYSASFAVALSGRGIVSVGRIWAEGKLLRGAGGDWKSMIGGFRLYPGDERHAADPLIAAAEGMTPAYRGTAYAVFEDLQLADFGNRIPSLTFEVVADAASVAVADIAAALSDGAVAGAEDDDTALLDGYAASGDSVRGAIEALAEAFPLRVRDDGTRLILSGEPGAMIAIGADELGASADQTRSARVTSLRGGEARVPDEVSIAYYDPARDWQAGLQRARRGSASARVDRIELPAALDASAAKAAAERALARALAARRTVRVRVPPARMGIRPGDRLTVPGLPGTWRVTGTTIERLAVALELAAEEPGVGIVAAPAVPGRAVIAVDAVAGATVLRLLDLPAIDDAPASVPALWIAAAGTGAGWRRATLSLSRDGGASWQAIGSTAPPAVIGSAMGVLGAGGAALIDTAHGIEVMLIGDDMWLESCTDDALANGANLAMLGDELIQFGVATPVGAQRFRLERLLRGRRGTEAAIGGHAAGERFVLIERDALVRVPLELAAIGTTVSVQAMGLGDAADGVTADATIAAHALRPPSPVRLRAWREGGGATRFVWTRRSRAGWAWTDGGDVPLAEEREAYRVTIAPAVGTPRTIDVTEPTFVYTGAMRAADGAGSAATCVLRVAQAGALATGDAAEASFTLDGDLP